MVSVSLVGDVIIEIPVIPGDAVRQECVGSGDSETKARRCRTA